jgi:hypothetical protein
MIPEACPGGTSNATAKTRKDGVQRSTKPFRRPAPTEFRRALAAYGPGGRSTPGGRSAPATATATA